MAAITLVHLSWPAAFGYLRIFLSGDLFRNHVEVHHVVARRGLMTLGARLRRGRRVTELGDGPLRCRVARSAIGAEQTYVPVLGLVTCCAVQQRFFGLQIGVGRLLQGGVGFFEPAFDCGHVNAGLLRLSFELLEADAREGDVIHFRRGRHTALVFEMAGGARVDLGVKGGRLALQDGFIVGMAGDTLARIHSFDRRVAGRAIILQRCVGLRQFTGANHVLPKGRRENLARWLFPVMTVMRGEGEERDDGQGKCNGR